MPLRRLGPGGERADRLDSFENRLIAKIEIHFRPSAIPMGGFVVRQQCGVNLVEHSGRWFAGAACETGVTLHQQPRVQNHGALSLIVKAHRVQIHLADFREVVHEQGNLHKYAGRRFEVCLAHAPESAQYASSR